MRELRRVCVFCGSSPGTDPAYRAAAVELGKALVAEGIDLVYGGGGVGLMGVVADTVMAGGGHVTGVIPRGLFDREVAHRGVSDLLQVTSMHERKQVMSDLAHGFVALPGGLGTLEEVAETATWAQLGLHRKPIGLLDVKGYWDPLRAFLDRAVAEGFLKEANRGLVLVGTEATALLASMRTHEVPPTRRWITEAET